MSLLAHVVFVYICVLIPWIGSVKYNQLKADLAAGRNHARIRFYRLTLLLQCSLTITILALCLFGFVSRNSLGLVSPPDWPKTASMIGVVLLAIVASIFLFRRTGTRQLRRLMKMAGALVAVSPIERRTFAAVAVGAGISEELAFRGFLLLYLHRYLPQFDYLLLGVIASLLFGFCHLYQGWIGILLTSLIGFSLFFICWTTASLLAPIIIHAALDLRLLFILTPERLRSLQQAEPLPSVSL